MARTLITVPKTAKRGEIIEVRMLIQHPMETGYRRGSEGSVLRRDLLRRCGVQWLDTGKSASVPIFSAELYAAIAANPYLSFDFRAERSGAFLFEWTGDSNFLQRERVELTVA